MSERVKELIESSEEILTSSVCFLEVKEKFLRENRYEKRFTDFIAFRSKIIDVSKEIALLAAEEKIKVKLATVDAIIYATAKINSAILLTGDKHFEKLENIEML